MFNYSFSKQSFEAGQLAAELKAIIPDCDGVKGEAAAMRVTIEFTREITPAEFSAVIAAVAAHVPKTILQLFRAANADFVALLDDIDNATNLNNTFRNLAATNNVQVLAQVKLLSLENNRIMAALKRVIIKLAGPGAENGNGA